jgi:hypothetical protein
MAKTYNSRYSLVVTHLTTNPPVHCLSSAERTGSSVFSVLWSYVEGEFINNILIVSESPILPHQAPSSSRPAVVVTQRIAVLPNSVVKCSLQCLRDCHCTYPLAQTTPLTITIRQKLTLPYRSKYKAHLKLSRSCSRVSCGIQVPSFYSRKRCN